MTIPWKEPAKWRKNAAALVDGGIEPFNAEGIFSSLREAVVDAVLHLKPNPGAITLYLLDGTQKWSGLQIAALYTQLREMDGHAAALTSKSEPH